MSSAPACRLRNYGYEQARLTSAYGGNALRVFYSNSELCAAISPIPLDLSLVPAGRFEAAWHKLERDAKVKVIEEIAAAIWTIADALLVMDAAGNGLAISDLDDYLDGIRHFNATQWDASSRVRALLTNVTVAPVPILECLSDEQLDGTPYRSALPICLVAGARYTFCSRGNWSADMRTASGEDPLVVAFEINNEPDYEWLPDENRIERSTSPETMPTHKYITELRFPPARGTDLLGFPDPVTDRSLQLAL